MLNLKKLFFIFQQFFIGTIITCIRFPFEFLEFRFTGNFLSWILTLSKFLFLSIFHLLFMTLQITYPEPLLNILTWSIFAKIHKFFFAKSSMMWIDIAPLIVLVKMHARNDMICSSCSIFVLSYTMRSLKSRLLIRAYLSHETCLFKTQNVGYLPMLNFKYKQLSNTCAFCIFLRMILSSWFCRYCCNPLLWTPEKTYTAVNIIFSWQNFLL